MAEEQDKITNIISYNICTKTNSSGRQWVSKMEATMCLQGTVGVDVYVMCVVWVCA